jgi:hypothetical protein
MMIRIVMGFVAFELIAMLIVFAGVNVYIAEKLHKLEPKFKEREETLQDKPL